VEIAMNRCTTVAEDDRERDDGARPVGEVLEELLAQYEARFPGIRIAVVETSATAL
jgi:hypothetical protein